jgi:hypothetical protein
MRVIPHTAAINEAKAELASALVTMVRGVRPVISVSQVLSYLGSLFKVTEHDVRVCRSHPNDFLLVFGDPTMANRVLHALVPQAADFSLIFHRWLHQARARFSPLYYKVLLAIDNILAHAWLSEGVQTIIGSSCLSFELVPTSVAKLDMSCFFVVAWAIHPDLIQNEVGCAIPEPEEQLIGVPPLFIREEELIHAKQDTL